MVQKVLSVIWMTLICATSNWKYVIKALSRGLGRLDRIELNEEKKKSMMELKMIDENRVKKPET